MFCAIIMGTYHLQKYPQKKLNGVKCNVILQNSIRIVDDSPRRYIQRVNGSETWIYFRFRCTFNHFYWAHATMNHHTLNTLPRELLVINTANITTSASIREYISYYYLPQLPT